MVAQVRLICFSDKCLVLNPDQLSTRNFVASLKHHLCRFQSFHVFLTR